MESTLLTLGVLLILVGLIGRVKVSNIDVGTKNPFVRVILGVIGVIFVFIALGDRISFPATPAPTPTSTALESHTPVILEIVETREHKNKELIIHKDIYFNDPAGDAYLVAYKLISTNNIRSRAITVKDDEIQAAPLEQKSRGLVTGTWECGANSSRYSIVLEARILDKAGNQSEPKQITFACE